MTFPLACPDCEGIAHDFQRLALAKPEMRSEYECSTCLRVMQAMAPVALVSMLLADHLFYPSDDPRSDGPIERRAVRALLFGLWPSPEALYIVVTRELSPFRFEYIALSEMRESNAELVDYFGVHGPATYAVPRGSLGAINAR